MNCLRNSLTIHGPWLLGNGPALARNCTCFSHSPSVTLIYFTSFSPIALFKLYCSHLILRKDSASTFKKKKVWSLGEYPPTYTHMYTKNIDTRISENGSLWLFSWTPTNHPLSFGLSHLLLPSQQLNFQHSSLLRCIYLCSINFLALVHFSLSPNVFSFFIK